MALASMGRANLLRKLDLRFRYYQSEAVLFQFPSLLKTSKPEKVINDLFIPAYPADHRLCLVNYLRHYEEQAKVYRESDADMRLFCQQWHFISQCKDQHSVDGLKLSLKNLE